LEFFYRSETEFELGVVSSLTRGGHKIGSHQRGVEGASYSGPLAPGPLTSCIERLMVVGLRPMTILRLRVPRCGRCWQTPFYASVCGGTVVRREMCPTGIYIMVVAPMSVSVVEMILWGVSTLWNIYRRPLQVAIAYAPEDVLRAMTLPCDVMVQVTSPDSP
jgi:hypothetical protein